MAARFLEVRKGRCTRRGLFGQRDCILEIEDHAIHFRFMRLLHAARVIARSKQQRSKTHGSPFIENSWLAIR